MIYGTDVQFPEDMGFFDQLDEAWENINATLEQSRMEWREMVLEWQPSDGESSKVSHVRWISRGSELVFIPSL